MRLPAIKLTGIRQNSRFKKLIFDTFEDIFFNKKNIKDNFCYCNKNLIRRL